MRTMVGSLALAHKANNVTESARKPSKKVGNLEKSFIGKGILDRILYLISLVVKRLAG
jgi:hypothetical protein